MLSSEVIVALALGIPCFFVAVATLWIAHLTYIKQSPPVPANRIGTWPSQYSDGGTWACSGYSVSVDGPVVPQAAFPAEGRPVRRRRVNY
ncbi:hypothetical protein PG994_008469 [Apiospora phragmitis]|uniref:Uncharacterized protein n=1 Tax=Apiospora phragmitis TaxID=2905665 RepID=A0ABR1UGI3_9PEZI